MCDPVEGTPRSFPPRGGRISGVHVTPELLNQMNHMTRSQDLNVAPEALQVRPPHQALLSPQDQDVDEPPCNCANKVSIEYLSEGRYRLGDKTLFIRVSAADLQPPRWSSRQG